MSEFYYLTKIIEKESGGCSTIWNGMSYCPDDFIPDNPTNGTNAYGLCQTMVSLHEVDDDFYTNEYKQILWCIDYIETIYGSPSEAWKFHLANNWY